MLKQVKRVLNEVKNVPKWLLILGFVAGYLLGYVYA
jgi:hypothetical protein